MWVELLGSLVRWGLMLALAPLIAKQVIKPELAEQILSAGTSQIVAWILMFLPLVWSFVQKWRKKKEVETALSLPAGSTPADLKKRVTAGR